MNRYQQRQADRRARLLAASERADREATAALRTAHAAVDGIPPGQPILVGHHSERHHRAALTRHDRAMRRAIDASDRAKYLRGLAHAVGAGGISADDPDALTKLRERYAELTEKQKGMKMMNDAWRRGGSPTPDAADEWARVARILGVEPDDQSITLTRLRMAHDPLGRAPYPTYALQNNLGNIKRIERRIRDLEAREQEATRDAEIGGVTVRDDVGENRVCVEFPRTHVQFDRLRAVLKMHGFKWSPTRQAWVKMRGGSRFEYTAHVVRQTVEA